MCLRYHVAEPNSNWPRAGLDVAERDPQLISDVADHLVCLHRTPLPSLLWREAVDPFMDRFPCGRIENCQHGACLG